MELFCFGALLLGALLLGSSFAWELGALELFCLGALLLLLSPASGSHDLCHPASSVSSLLRILCKTGPPEFVCSIGTGSGSTGSTPRPAVGASGECSRCCSAAAFSRGAASALSAFASRPAAASVPISGCRSPSASSKHARISSLRRPDLSTSSAARMLARTARRRSRSRLSSGSVGAGLLPRWPHIMLRFASNRVTRLAGFFVAFWTAFLILPPSYVLPICWIF